VKNLRLVFMGTPEIARPALEALVRAGHQVALVITQPDRRAGRGRKLTRTPVAAAADRLGIEVWQPQGIAQAAERLAEVGAQAACVMAYGQILPPSVLDVFPLGCINLHTSLLPELRGAAPINWAIVRGLKRTGVTTMFMDQGLDTGDIILQEATELGPQETAGSLARRLAQMGAGLLVRTLDLVSRGQAPRRPQDHQRASYAPMMKKSDGKLDWSLSAPELDCRVRGLDPWPSAFTSLQGKMLRLFAPTSLAPLEQAQPPGTILPPPPGQEEFLWVATGQGGLGLGQVQAAGKRRMAAADFLRGARPPAGTRLGS